MARTAIPPTTDPAMIPLVLVVVGSGDGVGEGDGVGVGITESVVVLFQLNDTQMGIPR